MRYIVATISFVFALFGVAIICGIIIAMVFPKNDGSAVFVGLGTDLRNLPGTILGILAGIQSWRVSLNQARERDVGKQEKTEQPS